MQNQTITVRAAAPKLRVADVAYNKERLVESIERAKKEGVGVLAFPRLSLCGCTCGDLFFQPTLLAACENALEELKQATRGGDTLVIVGLPVQRAGKLYDAAALLKGGEMLGLFENDAPSPSESRYFSTGERKASVCVDGLTVAVEFYAVSERTDAELLICLPNEWELVRGAKKRREAAKKLSYEAPCAAVVLTPSFGESSTDGVYSGHCVAALLGETVAEAAPFGAGEMAAEISLSTLKNERRKKLIRKYTQTQEGENVRAPFLPTEKERVEYCETAMEIQAQGLARRLGAIGAKTAVLGVSGGLDSTLALLVTVRAFEILGKDKKEIVAITMPGFGTTGKTYRNAVKLIERLGATLREIPIADSVRVHFQAIGHDGKTTDAAYENAQARTRTLILMDVANMENGIVVGTGDLSELALGWCTYNGDHMSMYSVNASIPKTLVKYLVAYAAQKSSGELKEALLSVVGTEVSPELLPPDESGNIAQKTEDIVGPYELHDFYLYHAILHRRSPEEVYARARSAFNGDYADETLLKWLKNFYRRFFTQQFKRSCSPDGVQVTALSFSPRGGLTMPSDACATLWLKEVEKL
ncbi:MAG: NAD(+) synthase [Clostridia bacterium]|nr:NAD(+) synthase [Clostridia bacterium]